MTTDEENDEVKVDDVIPKAVITVAGIVVFVLLGLSISKLVDYCYDRHAISDDASDISDYTKELLKAQLMLAFTKKDKKKLTSEEVTSKYIKIWRAKVARNKVRRLKREISMAEQRGTYRPGSSHPNRNRSISTVTMVNEKASRPPSARTNKLTSKTSRPPSARTTKLSSVAPMQDDRKGSSRPISAGLKSRPVSAKSFKFTARGADKRS